jgi:hypothetical protein
MAHFSTISSLIQYALFRAGEFTSGSLIDGDFYNGTDGGPVLGYINDVMEGLLLGSPLGLADEAGRPMPGVDWWWARKNPPGVLHLAAPASSGTVSITKGQSALVFSTLLAQGSAIVGQFIVGQAIVGGALDLTGYRIRIGTSGYLPRIVSTDTSGTFTTAVLDEPWPDTTVTGGSFTVFKLEYTLPSDFLRFAGEPTLSKDPWHFSVMDEDTLSQAFPISSTTGGAPRAAALVGPQMIRLSHYPLDIERVEFPYIFLPDPFTLTSTDLILPAHYRRVLAVGAAYYLCFDKADSKTGDLKGEFAGLYRTMMQEHNRHQRKMSKAFGRINYRMGQVRGLPGQGPLRTASGLIIAP